MKILTTGMTLAALLFACVSAGAGPLTVGNVSDTQFACVFSKACSISYDETVGDLSFSDYGTVAGVYTRTLTGAAGTFAGTDTGYLYRLDLTGVTYGECIHSIVIGAGTIDQINYTGSGPTHLVVVNSGWLGSIGVAGANYDPIGLIEITFDNYVCPGSTTYYFGFSSSSGARTSVLVDLLIAGRVPIVQARARVP